MEAHEIGDLVAAAGTDEHTYTEFIRSDLLSVGLAIWPAGTPDTQTPHTEDEVYHLIEGRAQITVAGETRPVGPGSVIFVGTGVEHRFHDIEEDIKMLVFWAPPRRSRQPKSD